MKEHLSYSPSRRHFMKQMGIVGLGFMGLNLMAGQVSCRNSLASVCPNTLIPDPEGILNLPQGFSYKIISRMGTEMSDGLLVPGKADGMAAFPGADGRVIVVRNHEISAGQNREGAFGKKLELLSGIPREKFYDFGGGSKPSFGGTTTFVYNPATGEVETEYLSLAGTNRNCAGGPTPWGSWLTCEEDVTQSGGSVEKDHGYVFEVPASATPGLADPLPIKAMGRFNHEAVCVDPASGIVYMTEDRHDGLIYRYIPNVPGQLQQGGRLQALMIRGKPGYKTRNWDMDEQEAMPVNQSLEVEWVDLDNIESPGDDLRIRGAETGAAVFARGEGMWFGNNEFYFACTNGGQKGFGQVFRYMPGPNEGTDQEAAEPGKLEIFAEPNDNCIINSCDNLTINPDSGHIILCEDRDTPNLVGITPAGEYYILGQNVGYSSELTGATFSPDGSVLFVNIQHAGLTLAIRGPWETLG